MAEAVELNANVEETSESLQRLLEVLEQAAGDFREIAWELEADTEGLRQGEF
jgi:hypothetical protein